MAAAEPIQQVSPPPASGKTGPITYAPRITANRRQIDNRFPSLSFAVDTGGQPYFEVILTTDLTLFDPANASKRTNSNFYSSRHDSGLIPALEASHPYLVPSAVLRGFAGGPRPSAIYFTLIAYQGKDGSGPTFSQAPGSLATGAPSVAISRDFTGNTLATVLSVSVDKLRRLGAEKAEAPATGGPAASAAEDTGEGEDGRGAPPPIASPRTRSSAPGAPPPAGHVHGNGGPSLASAPTAPTATKAFAPDSAYQLAVLPTPNQATPPGRTVPSRDPLLPGEGQARTYDDTYGKLPALSVSQGSAFESSQPDEPDYLADDEDDQDYRGQAAATATATLAVGYGDEAEDLELDRHAGGYQSLDGPAVSPAPAMSEPTARPLTVDDKMRIIDHVAPFESGGDYGAINADGEFKGTFGTTHPAHQQYHVGLTYGLIQFTQDSGKLGELLRMMRERDPDAFAKTFGPDSDELLRVTNAVGPASSHSAGGRSARVQPVAGADLWQEPWVARFRAAAQNDHFKAAQRELAAKAYLDPMLKFAGWLGLDTERALTIVLDRSVQMGVGGAKRWIISAVGPLGAEATRQQALSALAYADLRGFQAATPGLRADNQWGPSTHAAMVDALRRKLGSASPVPIPTTEQMIEAIARRASSETWHARVDSLRSLDLPNTRYQLE